MPIVIETVEEFRTRNGDSVNDGRRELFENGARIENGCRFEAPTEEAELNRLIFEYTRSKVDQLTRVFRQLRSNLETQARFCAANFGPAPHPDAIKHAKRLADELIEWKLKLKEAEQRTRNGRAKNVRQSINAEQQAEAQQAMQQINQLPAI